MKKIAVLCKDGFEWNWSLDTGWCFKKSKCSCWFSRDGWFKGDKFSSNYNSNGLRLNDQIKEYDGIVIPGGLPGATNLRDDARVIEIVQQFNLEHKLIAAICAGPIVLAKAGILKDKICTCSPGFETQLTGANYQEAIVQKDDHIITGKGPAGCLRIWIYYFRKFRVRFIKLKTMYAIWISYERWST